MTIIAQMVNVLQAMILTDQEKMILTPTYHVFKMHIPFQDATALPTKLTKNPAYRKGKQSIPTISTSAARDREGRLWLALVNTHPQQPQTLTLDNKTFSEVQGQVLTADSMEAQNTFTQPQVVKPVAFSAKRENGKLTIDLPAKSVTVVQIL